LARVGALASAALIADLSLTLGTVGWNGPAIQSHSSPVEAAPVSAAQSLQPIHAPESSRHPSQIQGPVRRPSERPFWSPSSAQRAAPAGARTYSAQPGDSLQAVASRFGMRTTDLRNWNVLEVSDQALLSPGSVLLVTGGIPSAGPQAWRLPDSEVVYSPGAKDFSVAQLAAASGGYLNEYRERVEGEWLLGPEVVARAARDHSINPRLLLAILEWRSGWVTNPTEPRNPRLTYPIWSGDARLQGLYLQLSWAANELSHGYYGWREGAFTELSLRDGSELPFAPDLNAATVAVEYLSARFTTRSHPDPAPSADELMQVYGRLFGDPWQHQVPIFHGDESQPPLALPFPADNPWVFTGGPHGGWGTESAWAALDFAPKWDRVHRTSQKDVVALADAVVARVERGVVVLDLDGDGFEQTGWSILYLHVVPQEGIAVGTWLAAGDLIGVAAEEGGVSHGLHLHIARKYNGEWIAAEGPLPIDLAGWRVRAGADAYLGVLYRGDTELLACPFASQTLLSVGGGEPLPNPGLPYDLRGCWPKSDEQDGSVMAEAPSVHSAVSPIGPETLDPGPMDLPPTRLFSAPY
jgi:murein DD-endopeptidase MepM/ murein hydrolase activator NlpD